MLQMACETLQFYRSICEVILKIHLIEGKKIKVKVYEIKRNLYRIYRLLHANDFCCLFIMT